MPEVAVYHPFTHWADNYSLCHIVQEQLRMLTEHHVPTHFVTSERFTDAVPDGVTVHAVLPTSDRRKIHQSCETQLAACSHVFVHDILYLPDSYRDHEAALRTIADQHPDLRWLHWSHSAPAGKRRPFPNSIYIAMNRTDIPRVAAMFGVPEALVRCVYNPVSPDIWFQWHPFTRHLVDKHALLECDVLITYPLDTGRWEAKGGPKVIQLVEALRKQEHNAKVVFVNAAANTKDRRKLVKRTARPYAIFTSQEAQSEDYLKSYEVEVPHRVVRELFQISNLFPLLSTSEGCSLTMLEAALSKNLVVLNDKFPPMREFGELNHAVYMEVPSTRAQVSYNPSEDHYFNEWAEKLWAMLDNTPALKFHRKAVQQFNREYIWRNQLEPLLQ